MNTKPDMPTEEHVKMELPAPVPAVHHHANPTRQFEHELGKPKPKKPKKKRGKSLKDIGRNFQHEPKVEYPPRPHAAPSPAQERMRQEMASADRVMAEQTAGWQPGPYTEDALEIINSTPGATDLHLSLKEWGIVQMMVEAALSKNAAVQPEACTIRGHAGCHMIGRVMEHHSAEPGHDG